MINANLRRVSLIVAAFMTFLAGCTTTPPRQAIPQENSVKGISLKFGGSFDTKGKQIIATAVQGSQGKSSDACKIFTDGTAPETTLYF